jgi:phospholipase D1/2
MKSINTHSEWVKDKLGNHPNISVEIHPNRVAWMWSHHEKLVVVDEHYAFIGGLDLCAGRWDRHDHPLLDMDPQKRWFPGIDYCNPYLEDFPDLTTEPIDTTNMIQTQ